MVCLDWLEGKDRSVVEAMWKFLLNKAALVGKRAREEDGETMIPTVKS
jgi:hypothetical protein